jgi:hypothetical protein
MAAFNPLLAPEKSQKPGSVIDRRVKEEARLSKWISKS